MGSFISAQSKLDSFLPREFGDAQAAGKCDFQATTNKSSRSPLSGLFHKYAYVHCPQFGPWRGAREGVYPQRYSTDRATKPRAKLGATRRAACLLDGGVVARSLQIHCGICSSLAPGLRPKSIAANVCVFMK